MGGGVVETLISSGCFRGLSFRSFKPLADAGAKKVNTCLDSREGIVSAVLV